MASSKKLGVMLILGISALSLLFINPFKWSGMSASSAKQPLSDLMSKPVKAQLPAFPERIANRISVPVQGSNEERRTEFYDSDKVTLRLREIQYKNGVTSYIHFRPNKKAERMEEYYPAENGSETRVLKTLVVYEDDGVLFVSHQSWRPDQTLIKDGARQSDGTYRTTTFFKDGVTIERVQNFTRKRDMTDETVYRTDGVKARVTLVTQNGERQVTVYRADKATEVTYMTMVISRSQSSASGSTGKVYSDDGQKVIANFESGTFKTEFTFLNPDEKPRLTVRFERTTAGHLTVDTYVQDAQVKLSQVYLRRADSVHGCSGTYVLSTVDQFAADNSAMGKRPYRRIYLDEDGITVKSVAVPDQNYYFTGKGILYELYPSGFVARKKVFSNHNTVSSVTDYTDNQYREPAAEVTDRSILNRPDFECPGPLPVWNREKRSWILD